MPQSKSRNQVNPKINEFGHGSGERLSRLARDFVGRYKGNLMLLAFRLFMLAVGIFLLFNSACTTPLKVLKVTTPPCANFDWFEIGRQDGVSGEPVEAFEGHKTECIGATKTPDLDSYMNGRDAGLVEFCSAQTGLEAGKTGRIYRNVCPSHLEAKFMPAYEIGRRIYLLELENADIERRINEVFARLSKSPPDQNSLKSRLEDLRKQHAQNENQINDIESNFFQRL